eukprot:Pgem_evm1s2475
MKVKLLSPIVNEYWTFKAVYEKQEHKVENFKKLQGPNDATMKFWTSLLKLSDAIDNIQTFMLPKERRKALKEEKAFRKKEQKQEAEDKANDPEQNETLEQSKERLARYEMELEELRKKFSYYNDDVVGSSNKMFFEVVNSESRSRAYQDRCREICDLEREASGHSSLFFSCDETYDMSEMEKSKMRRMRNKAQADERAARTKISKLEADNEEELIDVFNAIRKKNVGI